MAIVKQPVKEMKICFNVDSVDNILRQIDTNPDIAPKGLAQIEFYNNLISTLRYSGEMMEITVERDVEVPDVPEVPASGGTTVWTADDAAETNDAESAE